MLDVILTPLVEAVFGFVAEKTLPQLWEKLKGSPVRNGFKAALAEAYDDFERDHPRWVSEGFDAGFLQIEGAPVLAQFLLVDVNPNADQLAEAWARSLGRARVGQATDVTAILPAIEDFLHNLDRAIRYQPDLHEIVALRLQYQQTHGLQQIVHALQADTATAKTERQYLEWLIDQHLYIDLRGTLQTEREVRLKLNDIFITLQAISDRSNDVDKRMLADLLRADDDDEPLNKADDAPSDKHALLKELWSHRRLEAERANTLVELSEVVKQQ